MAFDGAYWGGRMTDLPPYSEAERKPADGQM